MKHLDLTASALTPTMKRAGSEYTRHVFETLVLADKLFNKNKPEWIASHSRW